MKEKTTKLLKNLLLLQMEGAGDTVNEEISIAMDLYCEMNGKDREWLINEIREIHKKTLYHKYFKTNQEYDNAIEVYQLYIKNLFNEGEK